MKSVEVDITYPYARVVRVVATNLKRPKDRIEFLVEDTIPERKVVIRNIAEIVWQ